MSARFEPDEIELEGLAQLTKALKIQNPPHILVGVLTDNPREKGPSNAVIGATHEYGSPALGIPSRSWLRMALRDHLQELMESWGLIGENELKAVVKSGSIGPWLEKIKLLAKAVVLMGFDTQGWGTWKRWSKAYARRKKRGTDNMILDDTGQLRGAVDAEIAQ
ncbi:MAG TPA: hypothetical protein VMT55_00080 [Candidatus Sulfotelmatobacter sp.]|nr:hypothetical protein [Candidatus Sulfotelmatobacter sp.]